MTRVPRDINDLHLAPVLLALDDRLTELGLLDETELTMRVGLDSDRPDWTRAMRESSLLLTIERLIDCHGWQLSWAPRGLRVAHEAHSVVLGCPPVFNSYVQGAGCELASR
ncbi:MAG: hypothetical protein QOE99_3596 [Actinomycetota bacterium]|jgi:hypothetical protein|nr:hypothetical protein [Actinomycetota bacterium]